MAELGLSKLQPIAVTSEHSCVFHISVKNKKVQRKIELICTIILVAFSIFFHFGKIPFISMSWHSFLAYKSSIKSWGMLLREARTWMWTTYTLRQKRWSGKSYGQGQICFKIILEFKKKRDFVKRYIVHTLSTFSSDWIIQLYCHQYGKIK